MEPLIIFFVGKPGSGKGTQTKLLAEKTGWSIFAAGDIFRKIVAEDTPVLRKVKTEMEAGLLMPHWLAMYLYLQALFSIPENEGAIFDGFNRKVPEAELIVDSLRWLARPFSIIHLAVSDDAAQKRLAERSKVSGRVDDHAVERRFKEYYEYTEPAIEIFRIAGVLTEVNGEQSPEKIAEDILAALHIE
ncbi:hypothetical protein A3G63_00750 [Candidatus Kaiserbacteria bacterium RIFCSPLOWO2_12_FULL_52_8]|uniref:Adenylate kinase n=1 Tax=Candidatus Kaiserbacteria bacterium RIFCSPHIGHO2_01_FULL_53_31 TaxID=1798481 RepID=A0A1F6CIY5_9BACT|nr:MAG: hypothetical protein A2678_00425 [Candidatus Kaiserbacteria bacterium RIFCSPHIGHO2_01_FULL_53_31]OGG94399.1 MAG: hypothetical protein A3G63_00750 [Candidatus Kaiserbacteria bacterium RIFCSPLOWO2_12_FULL_52_8]